MQANLQEKFPMVTLSVEHLQSMLDQANRRGAMTVLMELGLVKDEMSRAEMQRKHGRGRINQLISDGLLVPTRLDNGRPVYSESQYQSLKQ